VPNVRNSNRAIYGAPGRAPFREDRVDTEGHVGSSRSANGGLTAGDAASKLPTRVRDDNVVVTAVLKSLEAYPTAHCRRRASTITNAQAHAGHRYVARFDIKDCFPSVSLAHVRRAVARAGLDPAITALVASLVTVRGGLPQGAPTSMAILNAVLAPIDSRLSDAALTHEGECKSLVVRALWRRRDTNRGPNPTLARREDTGGLEGIDLRNPPRESRRRRHGRFSQRTLMMTQRPFHLAMCM